MTLLIYPCQSSSFMYRPHCTSSLGDLNPRERSSFTLGCGRSSLRSHGAIARASNNKVYFQCWSSSEFFGTIPAICPHLSHAIQPRKYSLLPRARKTPRPQPGFFRHQPTMAVAGIGPFLQGETGRTTRGLLRIIILCTIAAAAVSSRLFSVIREFIRESKRNDGCTVAAT